MIKIVIKYLSFICMGWMFHHLSASEHVAMISSASNATQESKQESIGKIATVIKQDALIPLAGALTCIQHHHIEIVNEVIKCHCRRRKAYIWHPLRQCPDHEAFDQIAAAQQPGFYALTFYTAARERIGSPFVTNLDVNEVSKKLLDPTLKIHVHDIIIGLDECGKQQAQCFDDYGEFLVTLPLHGIVIKDHNNKLQEYQQEVIKELGKSFLFDEKTRVGKAIPRST